MPRSSDDIIRQLMRKFNFQMSHDSRHDTYTLFDNNRRVAIIHFSRGRRRMIDDGMLRKMAQEVHAPSLAFFKGMIDCTVSNEEYLDHLRQIGRIQS